MKTEKVKCRCRCHTQKGIKHVMACCDNGWIEIPVLEEADKVVNKISSNVPVLSSFANRCLELIERGNNTFQLGWDDAIQELIAAGKIEAECGADGVVRVRKIA